MTASEVGALIIDFTENIFRYKAKNFKQDFKVNANSTKMLSERQYHILFLVKYLGKNTTSQLASFIGQSTGSLSLIISKMIKSELLHKKYPNIEQDNRVVYFYLSDKGQGLLKNFTDEFLRRIHEFYYSLSPELKELFDLGFDDLIALLKDYQDIDLAADPRYTNDQPVNPEKILKAAICLASLKSCFHNDEEFMKHGCLSMGRFNILRLIDRGIDSIQGLSYASFLSQSNLSILLKSMAKEGLVEKIHDDCDSRKVYFKVTALGKETVCQTYSHLVLQFENFYNNLCDDYKRRIYSGVSRLYEIFKHVNRQ